MRSIAAWILPLLIGATGSAQATTWAETHVDDPFAPGERCPVREPMSYGSYIYHWDSKWDQVFWPATSEHGIWFCPASGFAALIRDFHISESEREELSRHLPTVYQPGKGEVTLKERVRMLQESYSVRPIKRERRVQLLRLMAFLHENQLADSSAALSFRQQALAMIEADLAKPLLAQRELEYRFVAAVYRTEFGETAQAEAHLHALDSLIAAATDQEDEDLRGYAEYLLDLRKRISAIKPGGVLAPTEAEQEPFED